MSALPKVILITGANRGIGLAIVGSLATHSHTANSILLMGCQETARCVAAVSEFQSSDPQVNTSNLRPIEIGVASDTSIRIDALINNAGYASAVKTEDYSDARPTFTNTFNVNITSVYMTTTLFLPLLKNLPGKVPKVINISSGRASMTRSLTGQLPPTAIISYSVSKTALNAVTLEMSRAAGSEGVEFQLANPGHCRTAFDGYRGTKDPTEGADVVVELVISERRDLGFWETTGSNRVLRTVPW